MKILVAGWFSFEGMGATAGDLLSRDLVIDWAASQGIRYDVAVAPPFEEGLNWRNLNPEDYDSIVFVCGPFGNGPPLVEFLHRFRGRRLVGVNLTMLQSLEEWNPFDFLLERGSSRLNRPDLCFLSRENRVPVVGVILLDKQKEYGDLGEHRKVCEAVARVLHGRDIAAIPIDTRIECNSTGLRSSAQIESAIARVDAVLTNRLHGLVLALKNGVPAVAIDSIKGGAKLWSQAETIGWPLALKVDDLTDAILSDALDRCLRSEARKDAIKCGRRARVLLTEVRREFIAYFLRQQADRAD